MGTTAALEVITTERSGASLDNGMRTIWLLDGGMSAAPAPARHALAASLHSLLEGWRAAERQVAELVGDRGGASPPETSNLLATIARYRTEYQRIFDLIRDLENADEPDGFDEPADDESWGPADEPIRGASRGLR